MRVYELARELGVDSKEVVARALELGIDVKTASSGLSDQAAESVRVSLTSPPHVSDTEPPEPPAEPPTLVDSLASVPD